jgi:DNA invertase Pin-like site-specific DNA recombinase
MERPALSRLLADIRAGRIDVVVVYKVDRLTRVCVRREQKSTRLASAFATIPSARRHLSDAGCQNLVCVAFWD